MAIFRSGQEVTASVWTESLTLLASAQSAKSLEVYWPPLSEQSSPYANFRDTRLSDCEAGFPDLEEVAFLPDAELDGRYLGCHARMLHVF